VERAVATNLKRREVVKLCIPTTSEAGLEGRLSPHFGKAPYLTVVDLETGRAEVLPNHRAHHEGGRCQPVELLAGLTVDAIVCRGMGQRALDRLRTTDVPVFRTDAWTVADAVREYRSGGVSRMTHEECEHHAHG
jgi:predicted Fe-Mo cluster-binding NifX family protein